MGLYRRLEVRSRCKLFHHDVFFMMHTTFRKRCSDVLQRKEKEGVIGLVSRCVLRQLSVHLLALVCETRRRLELPPNCVLSLVCDPLGLSPLIWYRCLSCSPYPPKSASSERMIAMSLLPPPLAHGS